jgi:hypothetical protein
MTTTSRQNNLLLNQDWKRIYQTFKNADFKSYDFENLRRVMITYLRENYPEDFNDYIESSEYMALIDAIAFLGQSLAFRIDLASRENFIELAETKESVLRLARLLSYNAKRNISASGLLKFDTISTTESIVDSTGKNLSQQIVIWNDPTNPNWNEQFVAVLNAAMSNNTEFGRGQGTAIIQGLRTEQYRFRSSFSDVPLFNFTKVVANRRMAFEVVSTSFAGSENIYEEAPLPNREMGFIYRQDGQGSASANTGFFLLLKQGSLEVTDFNIEVPTTNEIVTVDVPNINNDDVWLYSLDSTGAQIDEWVKTPSLTGSNIVYNSISSNVRNIYSVISKADDKIDLIFADGVYGNLPQGSFRSYYRTSIGQEYTISPAEMRGIAVTIPYINKEGVAHELTINLGLKSTIANAAPSEDIDSVRTRAPAIYYTQNRMVTGEDYQLAPLTSSQDILKVKSINRTSSGISRNFDIIDASGKYSSVNVFADDGFIYKEEKETLLNFKYSNRLDIINFIRRNIEPLLTTDEFYNFYLTKYEKIIFSDATTSWIQITNDVNSSTGYFIDRFNSLLKVGTYTNNTLKYLTSGSLIKFVPPAGKAFRLGKIVDIDINDPNQTDKIWAKTVKVTGDGTNAGRGILSTGTGPIFFNEVIPTGAIADRIVPKFISNISDALELQMVNIITSNLNFGLRFDYSTSSWKIITSTNLNLLNPFSIGTTGDNSNTNLDTSWLIAFVKGVDSYNVKARSLDYVFGSLNQNRFYFDSNQKTYDSRTGKVIKDHIKILGINTDSNLINPLKQDVKFDISNVIKFEDGYQSSVEIKIAFSDDDDDGIIDNPEAFEQIVGEDLDLSYLFFIKDFDSNGNIEYTYVNNPDNSIIQLELSSGLVNIADYNDGDLIYFYSQDEDRVMKVNKTNNIFEIQPQYSAVIGRAGLKFQYIHSANVDRRIDPSVSNIIDVYLLTRTYDIAFRNYLIGATTEKPDAPTSENLRISYGSALNLIKTISDEIIYYPVQYKILFGSTANPELQAQFKAVKNPSKSINDNDLKVRIVTAINSFFDVNNWDFGDRFYLGELITFITNEVAPDISNLVIVPRQVTQSFGSLFEIQSGPDEIFVSGATVDDIEIVSAITASEIRVSSENIVNSTI